MKPASTHNHPGTPSLRILVTITMKAGMGSIVDIVKMVDNCDALGPLPCHQSPTLRFQCPPNIPSVAAAKNKAAQVHNSGHQFTGSALTSETTTHNNHRTTPTNMSTGTPINPALQVR